MSGESVDILVIGAGQAGLATGWYLKRAGLVPGKDFVIVDEAVDAGGAWARMWPGLRLFSPAQYSGLPGIPMPPWRGDGTPDAAHVVDYLASYEDRYALSVRRGVRVHRVTREADTVRVHTTQGDFDAGQVVSATGNWARPFVPSWPGLSTFGGRQLHTVQYRGPDEFAGLSVAVVGGGNSAAQIMAEIAPVARDTRWVTRRRPRFLPDDVDGADLFEIASARRRAQTENGDADPELGLSVSDLGDIVMVQAVREARERRDLVAHRPFARIEDNALVWQDHDVRWPVDAIIWATGFRPALRHLRGSGLVSADGTVAVTAGVARVDPRFHFVGYGNWAGYASATLVGVGQHARSTGERLLDRRRSVRAQASGH